METPKEETKKKTKKTRTDIPKTVREAVLKEFNHRCAVCGGDRPHLDHIDEDPSNNDPFNLLPLCPNCHIRDRHNPIHYLYLRNSGGSEYPAFEAVPVPRQGSSTSPAVGCWAQRGPAACRRPVGAGRRSRLALVSESC